MSRFERSALIYKFKAMVARGEPIVGGGAGTGLSAKCQEAGGIDLIVIYNSGRYRMAGRGSLAGLLAYGKQRVVEMVLAFATKPRVLLLDEPAAGLTTAQGHALFDQLSALAGDTSVLFIEHDMALVFGYAQRVTVLGGGALIAQGTPEEVRADAAVRKAYLGH